MKYQLMVIFAVVVLGFLSSCDEEIVKPDGEDLPFAVEIVEIPARVDQTGVRDYPVSARVTHPDGFAAINSVTVKFFDGSTELIAFELFDDGGAVQTNDRDVVAGDGIYTNVYSSIPGQLPDGNLLARAFVDATSGSIQSEEAAVFVQSTNVAPVLQSIEVPDTLPSGTTSVIRATIIDDNGTGDIAQVIATLTLNGSDITSFDLAEETTTGDFEAVYARVIDPAFAAELIGDYEISIQGRDLSDALTLELSANLFIDNGPPQLSGIVLPDTLSRASGDIVVQVSVTDPQGLGDIDSVSFLSRRPDGIFANNGNPIELLDNGDLVNGDPVAGDGQYSNAFTIPPNALLGEYTYFFVSRDRVGNTADTLQQSFILEP